MPAEPLHVLLSRAYVAFTIELDDALETVMPHRTTVQEGAGASEDRPWLVSAVMWTNLLRFVGNGLSVAELNRRARIPKGDHPSLSHVEWWRYVDIVPDPEQPKKKQARIVTPTKAGRKAARVLPPLFPEIEKRWEKRHTKKRVDALRRALRPFVDDTLPHALPVVAYGDGMRTNVERGGDPEPASDLSSLLTRVLMAFTIDYEESSDLSLPVAANVLRALDADGVAMRDIPARAAVSKEAASVSVKQLVKGGYARERPRAVFLTKKGEQARASHAKRVADVEKRWEKKYGEQTVEVLRRALDAFQSKLGDGLRPNSEGWRAHKVYAAQTEAMINDPKRGLPHHPMVLHRGGYPDGS